MKLLQELGALALGTRLALVAEQLYEEVQAIYRARDIDFDPRNFLLIRALMKHEPAAVGALAREIYCTHARVSQKLGDLEKLNLVEKVSSNDARQSCFRLSAKGRQLVTKLDPLWKAVRHVLGEDFDSEALLREVSKFEERMLPGQLSSKVLSRLSQSGTENQLRQSGDLAYKVVEAPFSPHISTEFERLNRAWLTESKFAIEPTDSALFSDLSGYVRDHNGLLILVERNHRIVATALLLAHGPEQYEIAKFCVDKEYRSHGIGRRLLAFCETEAALRGCKSIRLETSSKLIAALNLYKKAGYIAQPTSESEFGRVDLLMTKQLSR